MNQNEDPATGEPSGGDSGEPSELDISEYEMLRGVALAMIERERLHGYARIDSKRTLEALGLTMQQVEMILGMLDEDIDEF